MRFATPRPSNCGSSPLRCLAIAACCVRGVAAQAPATPSMQVSVVGNGWANSSVNTVIFRTSSVVTRGHFQYTAYYDGSAHVVLARRTVGTNQWTVHTTAYTNEATDAHNAIAIAVDGGGVLHVAWAEHNRALHYARTVRAGSLDLGPAQAMTGQQERRVTYPQFVTLPGGDLAFIYRDGQSGRGDVMLNRWSLRRQAWRTLLHPLISGEGARNAYVNGMAVDARGGWHLSWCWRESPDVATNHDVLYAFSPDEGAHWRTSGGRDYKLPITAGTAEVAWAVPPGHELINQTTMTTDARGRPLIASYWREDSSAVPQFRLVWRDGVQWHASQVGARTEPFRLSGGGTKRIPVSRPLVLAGPGSTVHVVFRDEERGPGIQVASSANATHTDWRVQTLLDAAVGQWEPTHDPVAWHQRHRLSLFVQRVGQGDDETLETLPPQPVSILTWVP